MSTLATLQVVLGMDSRGMTTGAAAASGKLGELEAGVKRGLGLAVPVAAAAATVAVVAFAASSVHAAVEFEAAFTRIDAISNASQKQIEGWRETVMTLGGATAQAPNDLADALFYLSSAGLDTAQVNEALASSAKAAAVGLGSTTDIAKITANALNAYANAGLTAAEVTDTLVAAVREGSADPDEFAAALGRILPVASQAGISFDQVTASLASLSNIGLDVNEGVTAMRGLLLALEAPTERTQAVLKELGLSADDVRASLSGDGLIATLRMLEERTGGNIDVISKLVPNVRALTGVFGLTGQEASKVDAIFQNVANSAGSLDAAFKTTTQGPAFQLQKAFNDLKIAGQKLAGALIPILVRLGSVLSVVADHLDLLVAAGIAFVAWKFLPGLLETIALKLMFMSDALVTAALTGGTLSTAFGIAALSIQTFILAAGVGINGVKDLTGTAEGLNMAVEKLTGTLRDSGQSWWEVAQHISEMNDGVAVNADAVQRASESNISYSTALAQVKKEAAEAALEQNHYAREVGKLPPYIIAGGEAFARMAAQSAHAQEMVANFAHMSDADLHKFRTDTIAAFSSVAGSLDSASNDWRMTAAAAVKATEIMMHEQQRIAADLRKLDEMDIGDGLKKKLQELGPGMVDAFVRGNAGQQQRIRANLKGYDRASSDTVSAVDDILGTGGTEAAHSFTQGLATGITAGELHVEQAARAVALAAVQAAKDAIESSSPSKVMAEVGGDFSIGFAQGIESKMGDVISAIEAVIGEGLSKARLRQAKELQALASDMAEQMDKMVARVQKDWDKLHAQIDSFKQAVQSGFDTIDILGGAAGLGQQLHDDLVASVQKELDAAKLAEAPADIIAALEEKLKATTDSTVVPSAADFATFLKDQLATAQEFAAALQQLQGMGLNQGLLSELASQGPAGLPFLQALISGGTDVIAGFNETQRLIDEIAGKTAGTLADDIFGKRLDKLGVEVENLQSRLEKMVDSLADKVQTFIDGVRADAVGAKVDDVIAALDRLARRLDNVGASIGTASVTGAALPAAAQTPAPGGTMSPSGMSLDIDYDRMADAHVRAFARAGGLDPRVLLEEDFKRAINRHIAGVGRGRRPN